MNAKEFIGLQLYQLTLTLNSPSISPNPLKTSVQKYLVLHQYFTIHHFGLYSEAD